MNHDNTQLTKELRYQLDLMRTLHDISVDISSSLDIQQVLDAVVKQAARLLNAQGSTLAVCEPETNLARVVALHNIPFEYEELVVRPGASAASHVLITGKPLIINNLGKWSSDHEKDGREVNSQINQFYNAILSVPLIWEGKVTGSLTVMDRGVRRPFNNSDTRVLSLLANLASSALNNAHLYSQLLRLNQQLENKVKERTRELANAKEELAIKAEQLQRVLSKTVLLQEEERSRIARDLHDGSNQLITGTLYEIQAAQQSIQGERYEMSLDKLERAKELLRQIDAENRRLIADLRPPVLDNYGLVAALEKLVEKCEEYCGAKCIIKTNGQQIRLPAQVETAIYRILQECLNNIAIHSYAQKVDISIAFHPTILRILVKDDGVGFDADIAAAKNRVGLLSIRERAQSIKARLELKSEPRQGTRMLFELPLPVYEEAKGDYCEALLSFKDKRKGKIGRRNSYRWTKPIIKSSTGYSVTSAVEELDEDMAIALVRQDIEKGIDPLVILSSVLEGLKKIGEKFETKFYYLGELLTGAKLAEACLEILDPYLPKVNNKKKGIIVIGAVQGDIHSIGYELVSKQLELAGYEVHRLGINVPSMTFIEKAQSYQADIIALSAFLVTTIPYCEEVIDYLKDMDLRESFKVIIGGSETNQSVADNIGADGWASDALEAVELCDRLLGRPKVSTLN